jgi:hypothetical protein
MFWFSVLASSRASLAPTEFAFSVGAKLARDGRDAVF